MGGKRETLHFAHFQNRTELAKHGVGEGREFMVRCWVCEAIHLTFEKEPEAKWTDMAAKLVSMSPQVQVLCFAVKKIE